jgi:heavy metal sensor kinase
MMPTLRETFRRVWVTLRTIRARLTLWYVALLALTLLGFSAFLLLSLSHNMYAALDASLHTDARLVIEDLDTRRGIPQLEDEHLPPGGLVALYDGQGRELLGSSGPTHLLPDIPAARELAAGGEQVISSISLPDSGDWRFLILSGVTDEGAPAVVELARSEEGVRTTLSQLVMLIAVAIPLILLLAVVGGAFLAGRALGPVDRITRAAQSIGAEDLSRRLDLPPSPDEVGRLAGTFDEMLGRLDRAFRRQQQFTADASHELRTPLAVLRTEADVALQRPRTAAEYQQALSNISADAARMAQLLNALLTLARADDGQEVLKRETLSLNTLADDVVSSMSPLAHARRVQLQYRGSSDSRSVLVSGDQTRLTELAVNLIDNGLKYTPEGGTVAVSVERDRGQALLRVADTGIGIAPDDVPHLFERFYRVDKARGREEGSAGLGLALAQWIVGAHDGTIEVSSQLGEGTIVTVGLPVERESPHRREQRAARSRSLVSATPQ